MGHSLTKVSDNESKKEKRCKYENNVSCMQGLLGGANWQNDSQMIDIYIYI